MAPQAGIRGCKVSLIESVDGSEGPSERGWLSPKEHMQRAPLTSECLAAPSPSPTPASLPNGSGQDTKTCAARGVSKARWVGLAWRPPLCAAALWLLGVRLTWRVSFHPFPCRI